MKTLQWFKTHKQEAALGGAGVVVALALYVKSRQSAAGATTAAQSGTAIATPAGGAVADTSGTDDFNSLEDQITGPSGLETQIQGLAAAVAGASSATASAGTTTGPPSDLVPLSDQVVVGGGYSVGGGAGPGGGYGSGIVQGASGDYFAPIATAGDSSALFSSSPSLVDYEPALGVFDPVSGQAQFANLETEGTTLFTPYSTTPAGTSAA